MKMRLFSLLAGLALTCAPALPVHAAPAPGQPVQVAQNYHSRWARPTISGMAFLNGKTSFGPGETINVVLNGTPGGRASFTIRGLQANVPMREVARGRYEGSLTVPSNIPTINNTKLVGQLTIGGQTARKVAAGGVTIAGLSNGTAYPYPSNGYYPPSGYYPANGYANGQLFVNVMSPQAGQPVGPNFMVTGQTVPGAQVAITAKMQRSLIPGLINIGSQTANASGVADPNGYFQIPVNLGSNGTIIGGRASGNIDLKVVATDPRTNASRQVEYTIATGGY
jgi:hypothetical protein